MDSDLETVRAWATQEQAAKAEILRQYENLAAHTQRLVETCNDVAGDISDQDTGYFYQFKELTAKVEALLR